MAHAAEDPALVDFPPSGKYLEYLAGKRWFIAVPLLATTDFVHACKDRGLDMSKDRLQRLEQVGILRPIARGRHFRIIDKWVPSEGSNSWRRAGTLGEGESWEGHTTTRTVDLTFNTNHEHISEYIADDRLWAPSDRPFVSWESFRASPSAPGTESFYSLFQCYTVHQLAAMGRDRRTLRVEEWVLGDDPEPGAFQESMREWAQSALVRCTQIARRYERVALLCQIIADRYYANTQSDRRTIRLSGWYDTDEWDEFCRTWDAETVLRECGLEAPDVLKMLQELRWQATQLDPLESWYSLVSFVDIQHKQRLKGDAQLAQLLYAMEHMLREFYQDLTGTEIGRPKEREPWLKDLFGPDVADNELVFLEGLTNLYHLNPRPRLLLLVEGESEEQALPEFAEKLTGIPFSRLQIAIRNLRGINTATGKKTSRAVALRQLIDHEHSNNTIVYCILDREGGIEHNLPVLIGSRSVFDSGRNVTKDEYFTIWTSNIEFDNFSDEEIARGLTQVACDRTVFTAAQVRAYRADTAASGNPLKRLYADRVGEPLSKPQLLTTLLASVIEGIDAEFDEEGRARRPIVQTILDVVELASRNHPPVGPDIREKNIESGVFG